MTQPLPFFPASLPDETLASRASRFHILCGNSTDQLTFKELFGRSQLAIGRIVPANLDVLASRLPGLPSKTSGISSRQTLSFLCSAHFLVAQIHHLPFLMVR